MEILDILSRDGRLEEGLADMLCNLVRLRSANWGQSAPGSAGPQETPGVFQQEPMFYMPDGEMLTMEEYNFMEKMEEAEAFY